MSIDSTPASNVYSVQGAQAKFKEGLARLDKELGQFKYANEVERCTGVPKSYFVLGAGGLVFLMIFFNFAGQLITNAISWVYPAYASFKAIESPGTADDKQWLTYWTVVGFVQILEYFSDILLYWFPFYYLFKTLFVLWLTLPQFRGAEVLYGRFLRPFLVNAQSDIDRQASKIGQKVGEVAASFGPQGSANKTD
ncbi:TB2/DP1, HVA22 family-domain-containing protein [Radiomyces spectabilis]|uniref:TB2/DP1, HVA22 family-domain-containing protein n=1 Tax=Radiomyces spectabilis TaxID=64574 RepID=UPI00221FA439|nr:TB2/DP1, HVA22 family-domain-containing protein [Radiomyces spectabilis]KAI8384960.1 TB2/DP1, HVA22 family-domain-containing protein [Radiomyces spectabilis]